MKCDELKVYHCNEWQNEYTEFYLKSDVDAAIDELKAAHHKERHEYIKMIAELKQKLQDQCISCPVKMQEDDVVAELKEKLEDAKATAYAESVDAGMRERKLKRALYKACSNWADVEVFERTVGIDDPNVEANRWALMRNKCLKKYKEYL